MSTVALYGFSAANRDEIWKSEADEIWTVNWAWRYDIPRIDRLFDMHPRWHLEAPGDQMEDHWEWLQEPHDFPIYMMEHFDEVPSCKIYPIEDVIENIGRPYFTSSISYLLALAICEGFATIELYGVDMANSTEYAYQKAGCEYLLGVAEGRGIEIVLPDNSKLLRSGLYGYDGDFQMIARQTLEKIKLEYQKQFEERMTEVRHIEGRWRELNDLAGGESDEDKKAMMVQRIEQIQGQFQAAFGRAKSAEIGVQVMTHLIDTVDLKVPDLTLNDNLSVDVVKG